MMSATQNQPGGHYIINPNFMHTFALFDPPKMGNLMNPVNIQKGKFMVNPSSVFKESSFWSLRRNAPAHVTNIITGHRALHRRQ